MKKEAEEIIILLRDHVYNYDNNIQIVLKGILNELEYNAKQIDCSDLIKCQFYKGRCLGLLDSLHWLFEGSDFELLFDLQFILFS